MRRISKTPGVEPELLTKWKQRNPQGIYKNLSEVERQAIREACAEEQYYLCAYCCQAVSGQRRDTMNEHVEARKIAPHRSLDFTNIVASCTNPNQCDAAHGSQPLPLTPFMPECETDLVFKLSGRVVGKTQQAVEAIRVLNLGDTEKNNRSLIEKRKQLVQTLLLTNSVNPGEGLDDNELIEILIDELSVPVDGKLAAFAPVTINILRQWISND